MGMQRALSLIYPAQCLMCPSLVETPGGLCSECWRETPFQTGLLCDACGASLPGKSDGTAELCDDCLSMPRPWEAGRAALAYRDFGRRLVLALKHGDRTDLAAPAAAWMAKAGRSFLTEDMLILPVPVHWSRLMTRRYNQAAELGRALSKITRATHIPDALQRTRRTPVQDGMSVDDRFRNTLGAIRAAPKHAARLKDQTVCLVDDVMTSGATLSAATDAARRAGATHVFVLVLARVEKSN
ncbi:MAG: ComF family protein [Silicimonas sp.]|nr:ComF family protein [Silicimonas sp.]